MTEKVSKQKKIIYDYHLSPSMIPKEHLAGFFNLLAFSFVIVDGKKLKEV